MASSEEGWRVNIQLPRKRKRRQSPSATGPASTVLSGSSSSSSDEDEETSTNVSCEDKQKSGQNQPAIREDSNQSNPQKQHPRQPNQQRRQQNLPKQQNQQQPQMKQETTKKMQQPEGWRVKLYRLNADGSWDDCGTGRIMCLYKTTASSSSDSPQEQVYQELGEPTLCMHSETTPPRVLLRTRILLRDAYQRQGDNIITWCEPYFEDSSPPQPSDQQPQGVDLALSFQDNAGCLDIWRQITTVQSRAAEWFRSRVMNPGLKSAPVPPSSGQSVNDVAHAVAAHHANLQRQEEHSLWVKVANEAAQHHFGHSMDDEDPREFREQDAEVVAVSMAAAAAASYGGTGQGHGTEMPHSPSLQNLEKIADSIAAAQTLPQRESLSLYISQSNCAYFQRLLQLFGPAEAKQDYGALATLAACIKTILLLNDPTIIEWVVNNEKVYEQVCSTLEYDPDLREKANHRWFLRERAKFRTVVLMEDQDLVDTIHRSFRVTYLRDTLLRPTMDESSLSTLSSLQTFTHADVVKGVTSPLKDSNAKGDSYLIKVIKMLGREIEAIALMEWDRMEKGGNDSPRTTSPELDLPANPDTSPWKQHLAPQDGVLASRKVRRRGCVSFFRELFNMVRVSLQQSDKDDFYTAITCMEVEQDPPEHEDSVDKSGVNDCMRKSINLLSLLGAVLADPAADVTEKSAILEIVGTTAMHDPTHIRRHCLEYYEVWKRAGPVRTGEMTGPGKPSPNERRQIMFRTPPNDLLSSFLFLLAVETDAGLLLQTSEIMRLLLDTDMLGDHGPLGPVLGVDENEDVPPGMHEQSLDNPNGQGVGVTANQESDQNQFLSLFYEHHIQWLVAPFQYTILVPSKHFPESVVGSPSTSSLLRRMTESFKRGVASEDRTLRAVSQCAVRGSFAVELLSFCVRTHVYRMKFFLLKSRVIGNVLKLLPASSSAPHGDRCLKLAALRFLRSILSVKDELYHRHIIQHNLFEPVFEAFRSNPVGDNLVSSAIVEMCDFIQAQNIKSLLQHIVTKHLSNMARPEEKSLEDVATPYVSTLTTLRMKYEENLDTTQTKTGYTEANISNKDKCDGSHYFSSDFPRSPNISMNEKALEDQRKFREIGADEAYFNSEDETRGHVVARAPSPTPLGSPSEEAAPGERNQQKVFVMSHSLDAKEHRKDAQNQMTNTH